MSDEPVALRASAAFRDYLREFRDSHPVDDDLARKHGVLADIGDKDADRMTQAIPWTFRTGGIA